MHILSSTAVESLGLRGDWHLSQLLGNGQLEEVHINGENYITGDSIERYRYDKACWDEHKRLTSGAGLVVTNHSWQMLGFRSWADFQAAGGNTIEVVTGVVTPRDVEGKSNYVRLADLERFAAEHNIDLIAEDDLW